MYMLSINVNRYICLFYSWLTMETHIMNTRILYNYRKNYTIMEKFLPFTWVLVMFITFIIYMMLNVSINNPVMFSSNLKVIALLIMNTMLSLSKFNMTAAVSFIMIIAIIFPLLSSWQVT